MEKWLPIAGFEGAYEVSDLGRVRSLPRIAVRSDGGKRVVHGQIRATPITGGYPSLFLSLNGTKTFFYLHHLVARAFIGPRPRGMEVAHRDGLNTNCELINLRYATPVENAADKVGHGTAPHGSKNGSSKLTEAQVVEIKRRSRLGERRCDLAVEFGVVATVITRIAGGHSWRHVR